MSFQLPAAAPAWLVQFARSIEQGLREVWPVPFRLRSFAKAKLPSAATWKHGLVIVTDEIGGEVPAWSDGTNWRRVSDRAIVS
ncbi:MAG: hypothetical protein M3Q08_05415 [Pseudomonadota bacterium]|nr:hypothetical protein [Pseudomonadota bacterium]